ncbi:MAG: GDSL-type esterase/lipase family protein [Kineosporiaceae bacterium]
MQHHSTALQARPSRPGRAVRLLAAMTVVTAACALGAGVLAAAPASAATSFGSPSDPNVRFVGRWDISNPAAAVPGWSGAYVTLGFTGTTVKLRQRNTIDLWASIDDRPFVKYTNVSGTVNLTPTPLANGTHRLQVTYRAVAGSYRGDAVFQGVQLDAGARTVAPAMRSRLLEFVGDSITVGATASQISLSAYPWLVGDALKAEHTQVAQGGACLPAPPSGCTSMAAGFLKTSSATGARDWDFTRYAADAVIINIGTNDVSDNRIPTDQWIATYLKLLKDARARYPQAALIALEPFRQRFGDEAKAAVDQLRAAGDRRVQFVDTMGWISDSADTNDGVHPNDGGHRKIAARLAPIVAAALGPEVSPSPTSTTPTPTPTATTPTPTPTTGPSVISDTFENGSTAGWTTKAAQKLTLDVVPGGATTSGKALQVTGVKKVKVGPKRQVDVTGLKAGQWYRISASVRTAAGQAPAVFTLAPQQKLAGSVAYPARSAGSWATPVAGFQWQGKGKLTLALTASTTCDGDAVPTSYLVDDVTITAVASAPAGQASAGCSDVPDGGGDAGPVKGVGSGLCLSAPSQTAGTLAVLATCDGSTTQAWDTAEGRLHLAGTTTCLQPSTMPAAAGVRVVTGSCTAPASATGWTWDGSTVTHATSGLCLDAVAKGTKPGTEIEVYPCNAGTNQQWTR